MVTSQRHALIFQSFQVCQQAAQHDSVFVVSFMHNARQLGV
jgi:hypothetical protein